MRWVQLRQQVSGGNYSPGKKAQAFAQIDARLQSVRWPYAHQSNQRDQQDRHVHHHVERTPIMSTIACD